MLRSRTGACSAGILLACAVAACSDSTPTSPTSPPTDPAACAPTLQLSQTTVGLRPTNNIWMTVTAPSLCQWTVDLPYFVSFVSQKGGSGTYFYGPGTGTVEVWLQVQPATSPRYATMGVRLRNSILPVPGSTVWLYQEDGCTFRTEPQSLQFDGAGGRRSVALSALPDCAWSIETPSWIQAEPASGSGNATLTIDVAPTDSPRAGLISMPGRSLGVSQTPAGMSPVFAFSTLRCGNIRPGESIVTLCWFYVIPATNPASSIIPVVADTRAIGGPENRPVLREMFIGGSVEFSLDVGVGSSVLPGLKAIPLTARDEHGRTATATATLTVLPPR